MEPTSWEPKDGNWKGNKSKFKPSEEMQFPALRKRIRIESEGLCFITPADINPRGPGRPTDASINNRWQTLRHSAAFISNIPGLLPVGRQSGRSRLGPNSVRPGANGQTHAVRGNPGPRLNLLGVQQGPGLGALFLRQLVRVGSREGGRGAGSGAPGPVLIDSARPLFKQSDWLHYTCTPFP